jgi:hypothetical protein
MKKVAIVLVVLIVLLIVVIPLGLWNSHGNLLDVVAGQSEPESKQLEGNISVKGRQTAAYSVQVTVDLSQPVAAVAPEYLSFAIDLSQRDLMV